MLLAKLFRNLLLSFVEMVLLMLKYMHLWESFASGPSARDHYDKCNRCRRYTKAFGPDVARDDRIHGPKPINFDFIACSGSRLKQIYQDSLDEDGCPKGKPKMAQAKALGNDNPELVTMSIGGNDVGLVDLLDRVRHKRTSIKPESWLNVIPVCLPLL